ncbi:signal peptidase II [Candidatus Calescamantes bacterium]|nr:signal peptidase II [Candidatus Calescamantes bacterium]
MQLNVENVRKKKRRERYKKFLVPSLLFLTDQLLKFVSKNLESRVNLIPDFLTLEPPQLNPGIAFGFLNQRGSLSLILSLLALIFLFLSFRRSFLKSSPLLLVFFGAISNLVDRLTYKGVVDYLRLRGFPWTFNLADVLILTGTCWYLLKEGISHAPSSN